MSLDPRNMGTITGRLVADPERPSDNVIKMRIAVDYAGQERGSDNKTGFFNVVYFTNRDGDPNVKFVTSQIDAGNIKKGTALQVSFRLQQDRWEKDGSRQQTVTLIADAVAYTPRTDGAGGGAPKEAGSASGGGAVPTEF